MERMQPYPESLLTGHSLEMTARDLASLELASSTIPAGSKISVTFLQNERPDERVIACKRIHQLGFVAVPHIAARRVVSEHEISDFLQKVTREAGVRCVFVIAGDASAPVGPYEDSLGVIRSGVFQAHGIETVGIAGYPEGHPDISEDLLWRALTDKTTALSEANLECEIVTQFGFDSEPVLTWLTRVRRADITAPVRVGMPGPAKISTLLRFAARCGVGASTKVLSKYGISMTRLIGSAGPDRLIDDLAAGLDADRHGEILIHLYAFGGLARTATWAAAYKPNLKVMS